MLGFRVGVDTLGLPPGTSHEFTKRQPGSLPGDVSHPCRAGATLPAAVWLAP